MTSKKKNKQVKHPLLYLLWIPAMLVLDVILFFIALYIDMEVLPVISTASGPFAPVLTFLVSRVLMVVTVIVAIVSVVKTVKYSIIKAKKKRSTETIE